MEKHGDQVLSQTEGLGRGLIEHFGDALRLHELIAGAEAPELVGAALTGTVGHGVGPRLGQAAATLEALEVILGADAALVHERAIPPRARGRAGDCEA